MPDSLSIITCTRDPRADVFDRVMAAVAALRAPAGVVPEVLLIDSASTPPLASRPAVQGFLARHARARLIRADEPGHALARRVGIRASVGELLVWLDDDNVPAPDYLEHAVATARAHPEVAVFGAGRITVEFVDPVPGWVDPGQRAAFQERSHPRDEYGRSRSWAPYFPVGSGMVTRRGVAEAWAAAGESGRYSLTGRRGRALGSGDDAQLILGAVAAGGAVGVTAAMSLTHLIPASRCRLRYLARLEYALASSVRLARAECFPDDPAPASREGLGTVRSVRAVLARLAREGWRAAVLEAARRRGSRAGARAAARARPAALSRR